MKYINTKRVDFKSKKNIVTFSLLSVVIIIFIVYISIAIYYNVHVFPNTIMGEIELSNCDENEVTKRLNQVLDDYSLTIYEREDRQEIILSNDIDLKYILDDYAKNLIDGQNIFAWPVHLFRKSVIEADFEITYNEDLFNKKLNELECMQENNMVKPVDAYISDYISGEGFKVVDEVRGTLINKEVFVATIKDALLSIKEEVDLDALGCYIDPVVFSDDEALVKQAEYLSTFVNTEITYHFGEEEIVINGDMVFDWIKIKKNGKVKVLRDKVAEFVNSLGYKYDTIFRPRVFMTTYGKEVTIKEGDYGWWMDRSSEINEIIKLINSGAVTEREPVYFQKAVQYGKRDYGNTYVEINLTAQHLFLYKDGKLMLESDFVSGKNTKNSKTPPGVFGVTYKERDATLVGEDYETPVSYWMPFNGNIGLHDATWRNKFGSSFYKSGGSHGCINLPFYVAEKIYEHIEKGTPVICYELPGTESKSVTYQGDEEIAHFVVDAIERIGKVEKSRLNELEKTLERIRQCYKELSYAQKKYVTNLGKLEKAEKVFDKLVKGK